MIVAAPAHERMAARNSGGLRALNLTARHNSPWPSAQNARVIPQPGHGNPVRARNGHNIKAGSSGGRHNALSANTADSPASASHARRRAAVSLSNEAAAAL